MTDQDQASPPKYPVDHAETARLKSAFTYHAPKPDQPARYELLRADALQLALRIAECCPFGRERALAITNLEQAVFWANAGIARGE